MGLFWIDFSSYGFILSRLNHYRPSVSLTAPVRMLAYMRGGSGRSDACDHSAPWAWRYTLSKSYHYHSLQRVSLSQNLYSPNNNGSSLYAPVDLSLNRDTTVYGHAHYTINNTTSNTASNTHAAYHYNLSSAN